MLIQGFFNLHGIVAESIENRQDRLFIFLIISATMSLVIKLPSDLMFKGCV